MNSRLWVMVVVGPRCDGHVLRVSPLSHVSPAKAASRTGYAPARCPVAIPFQDGLGDTSHRLSSKFLFLRPTVPRGSPKLSCLPAFMCRRTGKPSRRTGAQSLASTKETLGIRGRMSNAVHDPPHQTRGQRAQVQSGQCLSVGRRRPHDRKRNAVRSVHNPDFSMFSCAKRRREPS